MCSSRGGHNGLIGGDAELPPSGPHPHPQPTKAAETAPAAPTPGDAPAAPPAEAGPTTPAAPTLTATRKPGGSPAEAGPTTPATIPPTATGGPGGSPPRADTAGQGEAAHRAASSIRRLGEAIDALADAVRAGQGDEAAPTELAGRLASIWAMIADLDPAVAMRLHGYSPERSE